MKSKKAITLISLVVTIVVLIILEGVTIWNNNAVISVFIGIDTT